MSSIQADAASRRCTADALSAGCRPAYIFVSHLLVTGTRTIEDTTVTAPQDMPSIEADPNARIGKPGSGHAVVAPFDF